VIVQRKTVYFKSSILGFIRGKARAAQRITTERQTRLPKLEILACCIVEVASDLNETVLGETSCCS
jgi:hypothetical protein